jgi:DNA adenine methylase
MKNEKNTIRPFIKWAGGKTQILDEIVKRMPKNYGTYFEPFVGGGALFFHVQPKTAVINDMNSELISAYKVFFDTGSLNKLKDTLNLYEKNHSEDFYLSIRSLDRNKDFSSKADYEHAARLIYLNKACFNGLYRVNSKGFFNVPSGKKDKVNCYDEDNLNSIHSFFTLSNIKVLNGDFEKAVETAKKDDFVYFDPPYDTWDGKDSFTSYDKGGFGRDEQIRLAECFKTLTKKGVKAMLSNHNTAFICDLYKDFHIDVINARRMINSNPNGRGDVQEVLIMNY